MLVITRKAGDRVQIGDDITVTLLEITGSSVRLGIDAPAEVAVYRHEILASGAGREPRRCGGQRRAAASAPPPRLNDIPGSARKEWIPKCLFGFRTTSRRSTRTGSSCDTSRKTAKSMERLASGFRINRAADDAAGLAISREAARPDRRPRPGPAQRAGRDLAGADR